MSLSLHLTTHGASDTFLSSTEDMPSLGNTTLNGTRQGPADNYQRPSHVLLPHVRTKSECLYADELRPEPEPDPRPDLRSDTTYCPSNPTSYRREVTSLTIA